MSSVFLRLLRNRFLTRAVARLLFFREHPASDDKVAYHMRDYGQDPRDRVGNVQREQRMIHTEHREDPDDAEHARADHGHEHRHDRIAKAAHHARADIHHAAQEIRHADHAEALNAVGDDLGATCGNIINCSYKLFVRTCPDAVLVLGDTNSCLSVIGAKRLHIPIFHMEAGNRCKDECLPEETNRRIVDIISDVNLAYSEHARRYLAECGLPRERTYVTGSPMAEVLHQNLAEIEASDVHQRLGLKKGKYILLSAHREENIDTDKNFLSLFNAINAMAEKYDMPIFYSCHPRSRNRLRASGFQLDPRVQVQLPLGFHDYNCLQMNAFAVVSDSGTLPEESSFFTSVGHPFPAVCIRTSTERPESLDKAGFILSGIDTKGLLQSVDTAVELVKNGDYGTPVPNYTDENISTKVVKIIQSYVGVVNKMVWRKL